MEDGYGNNGHIHFDNEEGYGNILLVSALFILLVALIGAYIYVKNKPEKPAVLPPAVLVEDTVVLETPTDTVIDDKDYIIFLEDEGIDEPPLKWETDSVIIEEIINGTVYRPELERIEYYHCE